MSSGRGIFLRSTGEGSAVAMKGKLRIPANVTTDYSYVEGNPLSKVDPTGQQSIVTVVPLVASGYSLYKMLSRQASR